ncbi:MAG: hypothetical protein P1U81_01980 [Verrucomicrobiales bacterium]|jgi:hypothetical protein|nr:hypothetical protein [Verrucomicrobiales bacterium]
MLKPFAVSQVYPCMKRLILITLSTAALIGSSFGQGPRPIDIAPSAQSVGDAGIMWYTTWDTALEEAQRSNRPIFFMAAAATCSGIPGVF